MPQHDDGTARHREATLVQAVAGYRPDQFLFASPHATLLTIGPVQPLSHSAVPLAQRASQALADAATQHGALPPVLIGAVPFDVMQPARLAVTTQYLRGGAAQAYVTEAAGPTRAPLIARTQPWPLPADFESAVAQALTEQREGELTKVVLARTLRLRFDGELDVAALLSTLLRRHARRAYTYAVPAADDASQPVAERSVFVGASPELLVRRQGSRIFLNPLAGSAARRHDQDEDVTVGLQLLKSAKDLHEHAIVTESIARVLHPFCRSLNVPSSPSLIMTDALWHLSTEIEGELMDASLSSLDLALALHPTPAVCGNPRGLAQSAIARLEPFDRALFAGFVGWMDGTGDGEWAVALRCAECAARTATLYAGAGIVPGSDPQRELQETQTKFRTMLSAMGVDQAIAAR